MPEVKKWKLDMVDDLKDIIGQYPTVGIVNLENIPAKTMQKMRASLRGDVLIKMSRKSLMEHALQKASKEEKSLLKLEEYLRGQPAFIFSKINSFKLYSILEKSKANAPAKAGAISPKDIIVPKGETAFPPGPILGELQAVGIKTEIKAGKIAVKADKVVAKAGDVIDANLAGILTRMGIEPMEIGLDLMASYEDGTVFLPDVLSIDMDKIISDLQSAHMGGMNLSLNTGYITKETAPLALAKVYMESVSLALESGIFEPEIMDKHIGRANLQMLSLASALTEESLDDDLKEALSSRPKAQAPAPQAEGEKEKEEEPEEKEPSEEEAMEGLGSLFG